MSHVPRKLVTSRTVWLFALVCSLVLATFATQASSASASSVKPGPGIMTPGNDLVGVQIFNGHRWICISPTARLDSGQSYTQISNLAHVSATTSRELEYLLYTYISTNSRYTAASLRIAANKLVGKPANLSALRKWKHYVPASVYARGAGTGKGSMIYEAAHYRGPYTLTSQAPSLYPGQSGPWTVRLTSGSGYGVPHKTANFSVSGGTVSHVHVTTNSQGYARVTLTRSGIAKTSYGVSVYGLASNYMLITKPPKGQQQLLSRSPGTHVSKHGSTSKLPHAPKTVQNCPTGCNGVANVNVSDCLTTGTSNTATLSYVDLTNKNKTVASLQFGGSNASVCKSGTFQGVNGHHIQPVLVYTIHGKKQPAIKYTVLVIDCPPYFSVGVTQKVFCNGCSAVVIQSDVNRGLTIATLGYSDSLGNHRTYTVKPGQSLAPQTINVNASSVTWDLTESAPFATHAGAHSQNAHGTLAVTHS